MNFWLAHILMREGTSEHPNVRVLVVDASQSWHRSSLPKTVQITYPKRGKRDISWKGNAILDVSLLTFPQRIEFVNKLCMCELDKRKRSAFDVPLFIIFEEGHLYFPEGSLRLSRKRARKYEWEGQAVEYVTNGRNYNLRFGVITQFPSMIDKLLVKMTRQRYFGYTSEPNDVDYIEDIIGKELSQSLPILEVGEFVYSYPKRGQTGRIVKIPMFDKMKANIKHKQIAK